MEGWAKRYVSVRKKRMEVNCRQILKRIYCMIFILIRSLRNKRERLGEIRIRPLYCNSATLNCKVNVSTELSYTV